MAVKEAGINIIKRGGQVALLYLLFTKVGRGKELDISQFRELQNIDEITIKNLPELSADQDMYIKIVANKLQKATDYTNPAVRAYAANLAARYPGEFSAAQATAIFEHIKSNWTYVSDPAKMETFERASQTILSDLHGDCDSFCLLMAALILSIGGTARINIGFSDIGGHAWTEMFIGNSRQEADRVIKNIISLWQKDLRHIFATTWNWIRQKNYTMNYKQDRDGKFWLNMDYSAEHPGGPYFKASTRYVIFPDTGKYYQVQSNESP